VSVPLMVSFWAWEAESVAVLAPAPRDAERLVRKVALLEGELAEARWAPDVAGERVRRCRAHQLRVCDD
jgi:hypothetical protein